MAPVTSEQVITTAQVFAGQARDIFATPFWTWLNSQGLSKTERERRFQEGVKDRIGLVTDCYLTGAAMMLKMLHGDHSPEPWADGEMIDVHKKRLTELLLQYGLLADKGDESKCGK